MQVISPDFEDHMKELFDTPKDKQRNKVLKIKKAKKEKLRVKKGKK